MQSLPTEYRPFIKFLPNWFMPIVISGVQILYQVPSQLVHALSYQWSIDPLSSSFPTGSCPQLLVEYRPFIKFLPNWFMPLVISGIWNPLSSSFPTVSCPQLLTEYRPFIKILPLSYQWSIGLISKWWQFGYLCFCCIYFLFLQIVLSSPGLKNFSSETTEQNLIKLYESHPWHVFFQNYIMVPQQKHGHYY